MPLGDPKRAEHLWFVLTDPDPAGEFLAVNLTHYEVFKDQTVVLTEGHPFIKKRSLIEYPDARLMRVAEILQLVDYGLAKTKEKCPAPLLRVIRAGLLASDEPAQDLQQYLRARWDGQ